MFIKLIENAYKVPDAANDAKVIGLQVYLSGSFIDLLADGKIDINLLSRETIRCLLEEIDFIWTHIYLAEKYYNVKPANEFYADKYQELFRKLKDLL